MLFKIAWRNVWRNKFRSLIILCSVAFGLWAGIFVMSFSWGVNEQRLKLAIESETSHIQIHHPTYKKDHEIQYTIPEGMEKVSLLSKDPNVKSIAGRILVKGMVASASGSAGIQINGVFPEAEQEVTKLQDKLVDGSYFIQIKKNPILIGRKLAEKMKLKLRSKIVLTFQDKNGEIISAAFRVAGVFKSVNSRYDEMNVFVKADDINSLLGTTNEIHQIALLLKQPASLESSVASIKTQFPGLKIETWREIAPELDLIISSFDQTMGIFITIIMLGLAFGIINTMLMAVLERMRELGMLMAIGMNKVKVFMMILWETVLLGFIGCPIGLLLGFLTITYLGSKGIDLSAFSEGLSSFGIQNKVYPKLEAQYYIQLIQTVFITTILSAIYPAIKALRLKPIEAVRGI